MGILLRANPFAVRAHFRYSLVLTYALPSPLIEPLLTPGLELDRFNDFGFLAVALVQTERLRPAFLPGFLDFLGRDFFLVGYRVFVRHRSQGRNLRGLKILRSLTDKPSMTRLGNFFTRYRYTLADIRQTRIGSELSVSARSLDGTPELAIVADLGFPGGECEPALPSQTPFPDWRAARRFAGPMPFTFSYDAGRHAVGIVEGVRRHWTPRPVPVLEESVAYLQEPRFEGAARLASAFLVEDVPYLWKRGRLEPL